MEAEMVKCYNRGMESDGLPDRFEFTPEQLQLLQNQSGQPLHVPVGATNKVYLVVEEGLIPTLDEDYIRRGLSHAAQQLKSGQEQEWSAEEIKAAGRKLLARRGTHT
jgi:hypothetical protein